MYRKMAAAAFNAMFDYSTVPLLHDVASIRLLSCPTRHYRDTSPARYELKVFSLADAPPFTALSYVWGNADIRQALTCKEAGDIPITTNLDVFLKHLQQARLVPYSRLDMELRDVQWIWIDAICINQKDLEERKAQVLLMRKIYGRAHKTIVWLQNGAIVAKEALSLISCLHYSRLKYEETRETRLWTALSSEQRSKYLILPSSNPL